MARLRSLWAARTAQEQRTLLLGGSALALLLVVGFGILPLWDQHRRLADRLPGLRETTAALERQADEAVALRSRAAPPANPAQAGIPTGNPLLDTGTSLNAAGLRGAADTVTATPDSGIEIHLARVGFDPFMTWYGEQRRGSGLVLRVLEADALDEPGMVRIKAVVAAPGGRPAPR